MFLVKMSEENQMNTKKGKGLFLVTKTRDTSQDSNRRPILLSKRCDPQVSELMGQDISVCAVNR